MGGKEHPHFTTPFLMHEHNTPSIPHQSLSFVIQVNLFSLVKSVFLWSVGVLALSTRASAFLVKGVALSRTTH